MSILVFFKAFLSVADAGGRIRHPHMLVEHIQATVIKIWYMLFLILHAIVAAFIPARIAMAAMVPAPDA